MGLYHVMLNGQIRPLEDARVPLLSPALFSSFGVYESIEVIEGTPFHLYDHLVRMFESAALIELSLPYSPGDIERWCDDLLRDVGPQDVRLRIIVLGSSLPEEDVLVAVVPQELPRFPAEEYERGAVAVLYAGARSLPKCKSLNTLVNYLGQREAARHGAREAILCDRGIMTEGSRSNIFTVVDGTLLTSPSDLVLSGITRDIVVRLALEAGYQVQEAPLPLSELSNFSEMFVTSTSMHIMPVVRVEDQTVGSGMVGPVTADLRQRFEAYHQAYMAERS